MSHHAPRRIVTLSVLCLVAATAQAQLQIPVPSQIQAPVRAPAFEPAQDQAPTQPPVRSATAIPAGPARDPQGIVYNVQDAHQRLEMVVNSSRILTLEQKIPTAQVGNRDVLDLTALSPTQIQVFAKKAGVTQINLWNERNEIRTVDVVVYGDARELRMVLEAQFPRASLTVTPLANSVIIGGYVDRPDLVNRIIRISEDYHPNIINNITVGGVQQVLLDVKVMEVSRSNLRRLAVDLAYFKADDFAVSNVSGLITAFSSASHGATFANQTFAMGLNNADSSFFGVVDFLKQNGVAKIVADPKIMTVSGRPARFMQGGSFPVLVPQSLGTVSIEYRDYGTEVDFVPIVLGNGLIRLELRPRVSEPDPALSVTINGTTVPALTERMVDTGVEMRAGQTLAIAGLVQTRTVSEVRQVPWIGELPYVGALFRRTSARQNEVETLIMVTPHLVDAMDCQEVPTCYPGSRTTLPNDHELYLKGYIEVPKCCPPEGGHSEGGPYGQAPMMGPPGAGPQGGQQYYHGEGPGQFSPMPRGTEEVSPPQPPPSPMARRNTPPQQQQRQQPAVGQSKPAGKSAPAVQPKAPPAIEPPAATSTRNAPPAAVRKSLPPLPSSQPAASEPSVNSRYPMPSPPEPRNRTAARPVSTGPGFIGPTGYDVN